MLYASRDYTSADKPRDTFSVGGLNWVAGAPPETLLRSGDEMKLQVKVRHGAAIHDAAVALSHRGRRRRRRRARPPRRPRRLAPGQFAAFYDGEVCLGSGVITDEGLGERSQRCGE